MSARDVRKLLQSAVERQFEIIGDRGKHGVAFDPCSYDRQINLVSQGQHIAEQFLPAQHKGLFHVSA